MPQERAEHLKDAPLSNAPENELGVVFLFSHLCAKLQLRIERIQAGFPDCVAYQRIGGSEKKIRIEFEYRSRNFRSHGHSAKGCDWIVCWEHNWPEVPRHLQVVELRKFFGHGFKVWLISVPPVGTYSKPGLQKRIASQWQRECDEMVIRPLSKLGKLRSRMPWRFRHRASEGDIVLMYNWWPERHIEHIYRVAKDIFRDVKNKKYLAELSLIGTLVPPLHINVIEREPLFRDNKWDCGSSNRNITAYWWALYQMIIRHNPAAESWLDRYSPEKC
jgi:hypothetical protein